MPDVKFFRVVDGPLNIRRQPDVDSSVFGQLQNGQPVEVIANSRTIADDYIWWQHALGWSAERTADGSLVFMKAIDPQSESGQKTQAVNTNTGPMITLPSGKRIDRPVLLTCLPVRLNDTEWVQYFGNTQFAYNLQFDRNPKQQQMYLYSQGLHGGIDFGNRGAGIRVTAGVEATIEKVGRNTASYSPNHVRVVVADFTVIYGHMVNVPELKKGDAVHPDTLIGELDPQTQQHMHLEVRYKNTWILNPVLVMAVEVTNALLAKFSKFSKHFYSDSGWTQWQTPFDQPVLKLSSPDSAVIIGPRAAKA
jgi:hypothetical protein